MQKKLDLVSWILIQWTNENRPVVLNCIDPAPSQVCNEKYWGENNRPVVYSQKGSFMKYYIDILSCCGCSRNLFISLLCFFVLPKYSRTVKIVLFVVLVESVYYNFVAGWCSY